MIGTFNCLVIDCPEPRALAGFYEELMGPDRTEDSEEWVTLGDASLPPRIALQRVAQFVAPDWQSPAAPQQMYLVVLVENLDVAQEAVLGLGPDSLWVRTSGSTTGSMPIRLAIRSAW